MKVGAAIAKVAPRGSALSQEDVAEVIAQICPEENYRGQRVLAIVPDGTRTAPIGLLFQTLHSHIGEAVKTLDVLIALGTHQPMSEPAICQRLEISEAQRREQYRQVNFHNRSEERRVGKECRL